MLDDFKKKTLCLIPARKLSQRIKKKNKKKINGRPLILWTIDFAKKNFLLENIYVSSDDEEILEISRKNKINSIKRPKIYSHSKAKSIEVIKHFLSKFKKINFKNIILLQPTSPFRKKRTLKKIISIYLKSNLNSIVTVSRDIKDEKNLFYIDKNNNLSKKKNNFCVRINGSIYLTKIAYIKKTSRIYERQSKALIINNKIEGIDIDVLKDWIFAPKK